MGSLGHMSACVAVGLVLAALGVLAARVERGLPGALHQPRGGRLAGPEEPDCFPRPSPSVGSCSRAHASAFIQPARRLRCRHRGGQTAALRGGRARPRAASRAETRRHTLLLDESRRAREALQEAQASQLALHAGRSAPGTMTLAPIGCARTRAPKNVRPTAAEDHALSLTSIAYTPTPGSTHHSGAVSIPRAEAATTSNIAW